jgi:hypothetical protein
MLRVKSWQTEDLYEAYTLQWIQWRGKEAQRYWEEQQQNWEQRALRDLREKIQRAEITVTVLPR